MSSTHQEPEWRDGGVSISREGSTERRDLGFEEEISECVPSKYHHFMNVNHCNMGFIFSGSLSPVASSRALRPQLDFRNNKGCLVSKSKRPRHKTAIVNASAEGGFDLGKYHEAVIGE